jgi:hypothetical protein
MMSAFVWLDYSERERRKMLDVVDLFREHDTRDELGVGSVRDAFADMLFPGTSTIMTRARYLLLVPWAYQRLERLRVRSAEIATRARQAELNLVEPIERSDDNDGNIGKLAKTTLKRLPSSVYWQGLSLKPEGWLALSLTPIKSVPVFEYRAREGEYIPFQNLQSSIRSVIARTLYFFSKWLPK